MVVAIYRLAHRIPLTTKGSKTAREESATSPLSFLDALFESSMVPAFIRHMEFVCHHVCLLLIDLLQKKLNENHLLLSITGARICVLIKIIKYSFKNLQKYANRYENNFSFIETNWLIVLT